MKKIGFVIPWYGDNATGGIEREVRELTALLQGVGLDIEILTTCVKDYRSDTQNFYAVGESFVENVSVRRFPAAERDALAFERVYRRLQERHTLTLREEQIFIDENINSPQLYEYLFSAKDDYSFYVFLPYAFGTTYYGIQIAPEKSILIPCFQDEPSLYLRMFRQEYVQARGVIYHSFSEMKLATRTYDFHITEQACIGHCVDTHISTDADAFRRDFEIHAPFLLYVGRRDTEKNVAMLVQYFTEFKTRFPDNPLNLVLVGEETAQTSSSSRDDIHDLGYLSQQDKYNAYAASLALCLPAQYERFSSAMMESWICGRPVLANSACRTTTDAVKHTNGGLYVQNYFEFEGSIFYFQQHPEIAAQMGANGGVYVRENFSRETVAGKYLFFFQKLNEGAKP